MGSRVGLVLATGASLIVGIVVYRWIQPVVPNDRPAAVVSETTARERVEPESRERAVGRFDLAGDELEAALPELVVLARAGNEDAFDAIRRGLSDPGNQARERSVLAAGAVGDRSVVARLAPLVGDPDSDVREGLVKALAKLGGPEAKQLLVDLAQDSDPDVAEDAMQALVSAHYTPAISAIQGVLARGDGKTAVKAASALRQLGDDASADAALARVARGLDSSSPIERREAVGDIRTIGGRQALTYLRRALEDSDHAIRREAARAIAAVSGSLTP